MDSRERVLRAMDGAEVDRVPCALAIYPVDAGKWVPPGSTSALGVDVEFVGLPSAESEDRFRAALYPHRADTRLGSPLQIATYSGWRYHPEEIEARNPLAGAVSLAEIESFPFPDPVPAAEAQREAVGEIHLRGLAAGATLPHLGGELFETAWRLRGLENFLLDLTERPEWAHCLLERLCGRAEIWAQAIASSGIDVLSLGDDVGMPGTMMIGPVMWREYFRPRLARIITAGRGANRDLRILYHSDGYIEPIVADLAEIGVQAINPMQPEHMDPEQVRRIAGNRVALWGLVGHQTSFASASAESIHDLVGDILRRVGRKGVILCPAYDIDEPDTRGENIVAFLRAAREAA